MASPIEPEVAALSPLTPAALLQRKLYAHELADILRHLIDSTSFASFAPQLNVCMNSVLVEGARTPERDRARVLKVMHEYGGDSLREIAKLAKLSVTDVMPIMLALVGEGRAYESSAGGLFFLKSDKSAR
jgi:hypothetical protein